MTLRRFSPALLLLTLPVMAQRRAPDSAPAAAATPAATVAPGAVPASAPAKPPADAAKPPALPPDKSVAQTITINGKTLHYTATVGTITLKSNDAAQKPTGEVTYIAYVLDTVKGEAHTRPVTFAFNGGPGASSVYLNLGAIGPSTLRLRTRATRHRTRRR